MGIFNMGKKTRISGLKNPNIPAWQKKLIESKAKKEIRKKAEKFRVQITPIMDLIVEQMQEASDEDAQHLATYLCAEIICGFDEEGQRKFVLDSIINTVENYDGS